MTSPPSTAAIEATGLRKSFGDKVVLDGIDLEVGAGTTFSLLGPNGAGKTTTVQIMSTLVHADGGEVRVAGHDVARRPRGGAGRDRGHRPVLGGRRPAHRRGEPAADGGPAPPGPGRGPAARRRVCSTSSTWPTRPGRPTTTYSGGMQRRLDLAMTLIGDPRIIFLDEPTTGLDPRSRRMMWQIIRELVAERRHDLPDHAAAGRGGQLADRIAVLDHGKVVAAGTPEELKRSIPGAHVRLHFADADRARRGRHGPSAARSGTTTR